MLQWGIGPDGRVRGGLAMHRKLGLAGALLTIVASSSAAKAHLRVEVGILSCAARATTGAILTSSKYLLCPLQRPGGR
jgi:hypothetical protein